MRLLKILTVCGMGLGSALILKMQVESVLKEAGIEAQVEMADISTARGPVADLIVTSPELAPRLGDVSVPVVPVKNFLDKQEMRTKLLAVLRPSNNS